MVLKMCEILIIATRLINIFLYQTNIGYDKL